jgi:hypothetical protein
MPGYLIQYDEHPNLKNLKNQILSSCGHSVEHWQRKIEMRSNFTVLHCASSLQPCCHASGRCPGRTQSPLPRPKPWKKEEKRSQHPWTPALLPSSLHVDDHPALARGNPQDPAADPATSQHASVSAVTGASLQRRQDPRAVKLLVAWFPVASAYIKPLRSNESTHPIPSYLPDIAAHSLSLCFAVASLAGAALDERSAAASEHLGACRRRESEEEEHRSRSRTPPSSPASPTPRHRRRTLVSARR